MLPLLARLKLTTREVSEFVGCLVVAMVALVVTFVIVALSVAPMPGVEFPSRDNRWYASSTQRYRFQYPVYAVLTHDLPRDSLVDTVVVTDGVERVEVITAPSASNQSLFPDGTIPFTLHGLPAVRYDDIDTATRLPITRVVIERPDGLVNEIRGLGPTFDFIVQSFRLRSK